MVQHVRTTQHIVSGTETSNELEGEFREDLEENINTTFSGCWENGQKPERGKRFLQQPHALGQKTDYNKLVGLLFVMERNNHSSRTVFIATQWEHGYSLFKLCIRVLEVLENCEFEASMVAELIASRSLCLLTKDRAELEEVYYKKGNLISVALTDGINNPFK